MYWDIIDKDRCKITIKDLAEGLIEKCGNRTNYVNIIMGLSYLEDAEQEILPKTFVKYNWEEIKQFFINYQTEFKEYIEKIAKEK